MPKTRPGLIAPALAVAFAGVLGAMVLHAFGDHRAEVLTRWRAASAARVLAVAEPGQAVAERLAADAAIERARIVVEDPGEKKYRFLRRLRYAAQSDAARRGAALSPGSDRDKGAADAFVEGRDAAVAIALPSGAVRAAQPRVAGGVAIVDGAAMPPPALPWRSIALACLGVYGLWASAAVSR